MLVVELLKQHFDSELVTSASSSATIYIHVWWRIINYFLFVLCLQRSEKISKLLNLPQLYLQTSSSSSHSARSSNMPVHEFRVEMTCSGCANTVERVLNKLGAEKVEKISIDLDSKTVLVTSNLTSDELLETIKKTGKSTQYVGVKE